MAVTHDPRARHGPRITGRGFVAAHPRPTAVPDEDPAATEEPGLFFPPAEATNEPVFFDMPGALGNRLKVGVRANGPYLDIVIRTVESDGYTDAPMTAEEFTGWVKWAANTLGTLPAMMTPGTAHDSYKAPADYGQATG